MTDGERQERIHAAIEDAMRDVGFLEDGEVLTAWAIAHEIQSAGDRPRAGFFYGPSGMTTWRALGLVEWIRHGLRPEYDSDDEEE